MSSSGFERPYTEDDVQVNKKNLTKLIERQISKWPKDQGKFSASKTKSEVMKAALLDPRNGFSTNKPPIKSPHPPKQGGASSGPSHALPNTNQGLQDSNPILPPPSSEFEEESTERVTVRVYIEDTRAVPSQKTVALLSLPISSRENDSVHVLSKEFLNALQRSNSAIEIPPGGPGVVRLSFPDPEDKEWKVPFIRIPHAPNSVAICDPETIEIPNDRFKLYVDNVSLSSSGIAMHPQMPSSSTSIVPSDPQNSRQTPDEHSPDPVVKFLREKLAAREGYTSFVANRGHTMSNPVIVADWRFAVEFSKAYKATKTPVKVTPASIRDALGVGATWLSNAHTAVGIIDQHGLVAEVATELAKNDDSPSGSTALYNFLTKWKKDFEAQGTT
ncbi:hypothetical protein R3P38DRAFT_3227611 [Favolaschia claudopus]|uniref:Uncharacterized protein n=1 Tax=Favolaschia claudopus TaxID=2862362 RepID=A0AAV9ZRL3_9AGAR